MDTGTSARPSGAEDIVRHIVRGAEPFLGLDTPRRPRALRAPEPVYPGLRRAGGHRGGADPEVVRLGSLSLREAGKTRSRLIAVMGGIEPRGS
ncbi:MAG: hypothetical protein LBG06_10690 [Deltaproteobacteria bacterium]|nr:hypothetical protein [Deltaproteobacteria bacterium]